MGLKVAIHPPAFHKHQDKAASHQRRCEAVFIGNSCPLFLSAKLNIEVKSQGSRVGLNSENKYGLPDAVLPEVRFLGFYVFSLVGGM